MKQGGEELVAVVKSNKFPSNFNLSKVMVFNWHLKLILFNVSDAFLITLRDTLQRYGISVSSKSMASNQQTLEAIVKQKSEIQHLQYHSLNQIY